MFIIKKILVLLILILTTTGWATGCGVRNQNSGSGASKQVQSTQPTSATEVFSTQASKETDWTLQVNDTVKIDIEGISIVYTLNINAVKNGGTTDIGRYAGTVSLKQKMDASKLSQAMVTVMGGADTDIKAENVQIDIIGYDSEKFDNFGQEGEQNPLSQLVQPDAMALGAFTMNGKGSLDVSAFAPYISDRKADDKSGSGSLEYKISVEGGQVTVMIPMLNVPHSFHGMITGVPRD